MQASQTHTGSVRVRNTNPTAGRLVQSRPVFELHGREAPLRSVPEAYSSLDTLYFRVPGWPIGFGSDKKAERNLRAGPDIDPNGIDSNFFYAKLLRDQGEHAEA